MKCILFLKDPEKITEFLDLVNELDYIEVVSYQEEVLGQTIDRGVLPIGELKKVHKREGLFKEWDMIRFK
jgi:hypothetical protein